MAFKLAQTFYIDKTNVRSAEQVLLTSVDLYFKSVPRSSSNKSGILNPGVTVFIAPTKDNDIPDVGNVYDAGASRLEYASIVPSQDATILSKFNFPKPLIVETNRSYALIVSYDGDEDFELWTCAEGENILGTTTASTGAFAKNVGKYFEYASNITLNSSGSSTSQELWKPLNAVDLKFTVYCGAFDSDITNTSISETYILPSDPVEYIVFDRYHVNTRNWDDTSVGELVYQETPVIYGTLNVSANSCVINANSNSINFSTLLQESIKSANYLATATPTVSQKSYIVLRNGTTQGAAVNIREIVNIVSNTQIIVDRVPTFTNQVSTFSVTGVGKISQISPHWYTGRWWSSANNTMYTVTNKQLNLLRISDTNSNSTVRFSNNYLEALTITNGGTGYSNSDYITVAPVTNANTANSLHINYLPSYRTAVANVVTNGSGAIVGVSVSDAGYGLSANVALTAITSGGTGAVIVPSIGSTIKCETSNVWYGNTNVINLQSHASLPSITVTNTSSHDYTIYQHSSYYIYPGYEHVLNMLALATKKEITPYTNINNYDTDYNDGRVYVMTSRSNEVLGTSNVVINVANGSTLSTMVQSPSILEVNVTSNNAFSLPMVASQNMYSSKYIVNNLTTKETKGNGSALARHISKSVTFNEGRNAEDIVVYLTAYRPAGTNVKVYARLLSRTDNDAFDDKDWTELSLQSNNATTYSTLSDESDVIEFKYGLPTSPSVYSTLSGTATASAYTLTGIGTDWNTSLQVNDVVKVYSKLFPTNYAVSVVRAVTSATSITLDDQITDPSLTGTLSVDLVGRPGTTELGNPHAAWSNRPNSFVCRYYNGAMSKMDTYCTFAIKIVLLASNSSVVPKIINTRAVGVSA